jgi:hypothetical protein
MTTKPAGASPVERHVRPRSANTNGWIEAAIAWEVCGSIHATWAKGKDALFTTRQADFVKHANDARMKASTQHSNDGSGRSHKRSDDMTEERITELWNKAVAEIGDCTYPQIITRFAELVAADERDKAWDSAICECIKVAEEEAEDWEKLRDISLARQESAVIEATNILAINRCIDLMKTMSSNAGEKK